MWILLFAGFIQFWGFKDLHRPWRSLENFQRFVRDEISTSTNIIRHQSFIYNCRLIHFNFLMQYNVVIRRVILTGKKFFPSIYLEVCISIYYVHFIPRGAWRVFKWRVIQKLINYGNSSKFSLWWCMQYQNELKTDFWYRNDYRIAPKSTHNLVENDY